MQGEGRNACVVARSLRRGVRIPLDPVAVRVLVLTKIFPNALEPGSSPFNRQQLAALRRRPEIEALEVLTAIPWLPGGRLVRRWSRAGRLIDLPVRDAFDGVPSENVRVAYLPRVGDAIAPELYAASMLPAVLRRRGRYDVLLGSWAYPDGVAAIELARLMHLPAVVKAHGSDLNVLAERPVVRARLRRWLPRADAIVAPSRALLARAEALGVDPSRASLVANGVDVVRFHPRDRVAARARLDLPRDAAIVVVVGRVERAKGSLDLLAALPAVRAACPRVAVIFVGGGPELDLVRRAASADPSARFVGARPHDEIPEWLAAADLVALPSWSEGTPNVLLEAFACGRPIVATRVGGIPDLLADDGRGRDAVLGELVPPRDPDALAGALVRALRRPAGDPARLAACAHVGSWDQSAEALSAALTQAIERARARRGAS